MTRASRVMRRVALGLMATVTLLLGLFVAGYAFEDPGGWQATGTVAAVAVPLVVLTFLAHRWPTIATWLLAVGVLVVAGLAVLDAPGNGGQVLVRVPGALAAINLLTLGVPMATVGLKRPLAGGLLLVAAALAAYLPNLPMVLREGISLGVSLTWSSTVLVGPCLVAGALLLVAAVLGHDAGARPPHPAVPQQPVGAPSSG
jgi:hypothetical protein